MRNTQPPILFALCLSLSVGSSIMHSQVFPGFRGIANDAISGGQTPDDDNIFPLGDGHCGV
jgi:hypothetical protein